MIRTMKSKLEMKELFLDEKYVREENGYKWGDVQSTDSMMRHCGKTCEVNYLPAGNLHGYSHSVTIEDTTFYIVEEWLVPIEEGSIQTSTSSLTYEQYLTGQIVGGLLANGSVNYSFPREVKEVTREIVNIFLKEEKNG